MLRTRSDSHYRYLDFQDAEVGDSFALIRHSSYGSKVRAIVSGTIVDVDERWVRCTSCDARCLTAGLVAIPAETGATRCVPGR